MSNLIREQLATAVGALKNIAFRNGSDAKLASEAIAHIERMKANWNDKPDHGCEHCAAGRPRIRFNTIFLHEIDGNEVACTEPQSRDQNNGPG
jgi:hypothetical protein